MDVFNIAGDAGNKILGVSVRVWRVGEAEQTATLIIHSGAEHRASDPDWSGLTPDELTLEAKAGAQVADWLLHNLPAGVIAPLSERLASRVAGASHAQ